jgi:L-ascorbate metabolism protein UlaG (beta-lactamase superfamily)
MKHFDGKRYYNPGVAPVTLKDVFKWTLTRKPPKRTKRSHKILFQPKESKPNELRVTFVNHSTVLIQWKGKNVLTDPIWSKRCSPIKWVGPKRLHPPGIPFEDLPPIDLVLLSHNHYDHLDIPTLKRLNKRFHPLILTGLGNKKLLNRNGISHVHEMDWWEEIHITDTLSIAFVPAQHQSGRKGYDQCKTLWGGFVVMDGNENIYFAGDTAYSGFYKEIKKKYGPPKLALLPIGAYKPRWFMKRFHQSPEEAVKAHQDLHAEHSLGIHFGTFLLSDEKAEDPPSELEESLKEANISKEDFFTLLPGESRDL